MVATLASFAVSVSLVSTPPPPAVAAGPTLYIVTNTSGDPTAVGSLPWAVRQANYATKGFDRIRFDLPASPAPHIVLSQPLWINDQVDISGPPVEMGLPPMIGIRGNSLPYLYIMQSDPARGVTSSSSTIAGLAMTGFTDAAIITKPEAQGLFIQNNWIGVQPDSSDLAGAFSNRRVTPAGTLADGIEINSSYNTVRNNEFSYIDFGVILGGRMFPGNIVKTNSIQRNVFGLARSGEPADGSAALTGDGVFLWDGAQENFIGPRNLIGNLEGVGVELVHASNVLNVIFDNDIGGAVAGIAIGGGVRGNAIGGPFGGNQVMSPQGLVLGFGVKNAAYNTWVEGNTFRGVTTDSYRGSFGVLIQGGSTGNFLGSNAFLYRQVGVFLGDEVARGTGKNAVNGNRFGATYGGCEWSTVEFNLYFSYSNYNFARDNRSTNSYYYQHRSTGNSISFRSICSSNSPPESAQRPAAESRSELPTPPPPIGHREPG